MNAGAERHQLSLFVSGPDSERLEACRRRLDPVQAALIPAHVTLCREDELSMPLDAALLATRLQGAPPLILQFGPPEHFGGHGILLPCIAGQQAFDALRRQVLGRGDIPHASAHLTLAHPRNPKSPHNRLSLDEFGSGLQLTLTDLRWVRQRGTAPWQTLLSRPDAGAATASKT